MKKFPLFEVVVILTVLFSHGIAAVSSEPSLMNWFQSDDAFYYFNTAKNISEGLGVTFDGMNSTNGFHPLWMLVCIPIFSLARYDLYLPFRLLIIFMGVLNAATALIIYRWLTDVLSKGAGILGAIVWAFTPLIHSFTSESGIETGLSVFFLFLLLSHVSKLSQATIKIPTKNLIFTGVIASLAFLARLDNIFIISMLGIWLIFSNTIFRHFLVIDSLFIIFSAFTSLIIRLGNFVDLYTFSSGVFIFIGFGLIIKIPIYYLFGLYQPTGNLSIGILFKKTLLAVTIAEVFTTIPVFLTTILLTGVAFPRSLPAIDYFLTLVLVFGFRLLVYFFSENKNGNNQPPLKVFEQNWRNWLRSGSFYFGIFLVTLIVYSLFNLVFFQTPMPVSGQIKQWWGTMYTVYGEPEKTFLGVLGLGIDKWGFFSSILSLPTTIIPARFLFPIYLIIILFLAFIVIKNIKEFKNSFDNLLLLPLLGGVFWQIWTYNIRSYVGFRNWYWVSQLIFSVLCLILIYHLMTRIFKKPVIQNLAVSASIVIIGITILSSYFTHIIDLVNFHYSGLDEGNYLFLASSLESNTEPGAIIGLTGGGSTGYFINNRIIVNLDGLINSYSYFQAMKNLKAAEFLDDLGLDYILAKPYIILESDPYQFEFPNRLEFIKYIDTYALYQYQTAP